MSHTLDEIKQDLKFKNEKEFYTKHIIRSDNWYFEQYMGKEPDEVLKISDDYRLIISENLQVSFNSVMMVGSGKIGFSLSPPNNMYNKESKLFLPFNDNEKVRKVSDIDIAIISSDIFHYYWNLFRHSYKNKYKDTYQHIYQGLYRGYIDERNITFIDGCRKEWNETASISKKRLHNELYFKHDISYRIYRNWEDFEDYNLQNLRKIKREIEL